ncbi:exodeoxyribonuclease VII large subunit [Virgibacillus halodenitrificans]|uniref:exodeoxyribonuclease VII large subunit n=1 Tax=Virgibacillus halodenitrificans TaxID=1482 RepID=UPI0024BF5FE9|nr:exodeoxyribonuclease VII large subunit [Virgibacillus halodenitrificans]WHX27471.1 exodeoxyribonuclease VII large subunit [Virgibacillus halodenitrificans]
MKDNYLTVTALTKYLKRKLETDPHLKNVWLKGEISNFKHHSRGHMYLTIKDDQTRIQAVMFAGNNRFLKFIPENGMKVLIKGEISIFEAYGQYQLYIQNMEPDGIGALYLAFEQLKEKLHKKGYFDQQYKKQIPVHPKHIGVITSPTGAAVRDIITTIKRRYPIVSLTVIPVLVQGQNATNSIKQAIDKANEMAMFDVLIVGRGGGSIEELWSFNEEIVAEAIFRSSIPIISAVGHETDLTISDFVADMRAPTPTGAAELAVPSHIELRERIKTLRRSVKKEMARKVMEEERQVQRIKDSYAFRYPQLLLKQKEQELDQSVGNLQKSAGNYVKETEKAYRDLFKRLLAQHPKNQIQQSHNELDQLTKRQKYCMNLLIEQSSNQLQNTIDKLTLVNPLAIMQRGFAIPYTQRGNILKSAKQVKEKESIILHMADGRLSCYVEKVEEEHNGGKQ